ncbi:hypothetical protein KNSL1_007989 [Colletotrichum chrysophilum]|nr:hypothetical protein KNSL1_007989 [Colletotrichum chrysophilum]
MARGAPRSRARAHAHEFVVVEDDTATTDISKQHASIDANIALLDRHDTNTERSPHDFIDHLTDKLKELHIYSPKKNRGDRSLLPISNSRPTRLSVHSVDTEIFPLLEVVKEEAEDCDNCPAETIYAQGPIPAQPPRVIEGVPSLAETNALTASASQAQDSFEASVPSEATPLGHEEVVSQPAHRYSEVEEAMAIAEPVVRLLSPTPVGNDTASNKTSQSGITVTIVEQTRPNQMEPSAKATENRKESSVDRKSVSIVDDKRATGSPAKATPTRSSVSRPTSLLPPIKSTKPPTKPSFELPGEAVARRLKEQREARQAQQAQDKAAAAAAEAPQRRKSTKALTRPTFELPGEAISKRKREDREARLRQQEEDERKRREFKARPIRAKLNSASYPRETATSRARQGKASESSEAAQVEQSPSKRSSIIMTPRTQVTRTTSNRSPQARGRGLSQATVTSQISRGTSTSTTSMGKRSTLSAEDLEQQKMKGREVFERDNGYLEDKERERRERELNAKLAREQAAERSRQASREWAEKQRRKQLAAANAAARQAV